MQVASHKVVSIQYTLKDTDDQIIDQTQDDQEFSYVHGVGATIAGLESALDGQSPGDHVDVTVSPDQAYGARDENLKQTVPRSLFQGVDDVQPGMQFQAEAEGGSRVVTVAEVEGDEVTVDANHPLAGVELHFEVDVKHVRDATEDEVATRSPAQIQA